MPLKFWNTPLLEKSEVNIGWVARQTYNVPSWGVHVFENEHCGTNGLHPCAGVLIVNPTEGLNDVLVGHYLTGPGHEWLLETIRSTAQQAFPDFAEVRAFLWWASLNTYNAFPQPEVELLFLNGVITNRKSVLELCSTLWITPEHIHTEWDRRSNPADRIQEAQMWYDPTTKQVTYVYLGYEWYRENIISLDSK
jgi:hypothetical protein